MKETIKKSKNYKKLYKKYKEKFLKAESEKQAFRDAVTLLKDQNSMLQSQLLAAEAKATKALTRLGQIEHESAMSARKALDLQYLEIDGAKPILWINTSDPRIANAATFGNIRDRLMRIAPGIEMIVLTYGDVKIWELETKDLEKLGLCRIANHNGGIFGVQDPKRLTDGK